MNFEMMLELVDYGVSCQGALFLCLMQKYVPIVFGHCYLLMLNLSS